MTGDAAAPRRSPPLQNRWIILAAVFLARTGVGFQFIAVAALMADIQGSLGFTYADIGVLLGAYMVAGVALSLPSGLITDVFGDRRILLAGLLALVASGLLVAQTHHFASALVGRLCGGVGAVLITVTGAKVLTGRFVGREIATAMSCLGVAWPAGIALGLVALPFLDASIGWRGCMLITAVPPITAALAILFTTMVDVSTSPSDEPGKARRLWSITGRETVLILLAGLAWSLMSSGGYVVFSSYAPTYLAGGGMSRDAATVVVGILSWLIILTIPAGGVLVDRFGHGDKVFSAGCLVSSAAICALALGAPVIPCIVLASVLGFTVGTVMALPSRVLQTSSYATGIGLFYTVYYAGTAAFPAAAGFVVGASGRADAAVWLSAACLLVAPVMLHLFRRAG